MLAQNAIVVTTYETLASDATYHAKKGGADYCAPCEQVRWWRIICDESHSLRESNTKKSMAVMNLVADHKWLVSGTPVNTSFKDLKNQLKFIGLENVDEMFNGFGDTAMKHVNDPNRPKSRGRPFCRDDRVFGHFVFMLRSIIVRHTHKQTYRGTTTTLMSLPPKVRENFCTYSSVPVHSFLNQRFSCPYLSRILCVDGTNGGSQFFRRREGGLQCT